MVGNHSVRIGALSKLTDLPPETIRTWERRYALLNPQRDERGDRLYALDDVERLRLIVALRQRGEAISSLASLSTADLRERLGLFDDEGEDLGLSRLDIVVVYPGGGEALDGVTRDAASRVRVVASAGRPDQLPSASGPVQALVLDLLALGDHPEAWVEELRSAWSAPSVIVLYHFMSRRHREALARLGVRLVPATSDLSAVRQAVVDQVTADRIAAGHVPDEDHPGAPRFDRTTLEGLTQARSELACECPRHVAGLVLSLQQFEAYARRCVLESPEDAALHRDLARGTGEARRRMEQLLARVCAEDGILL